MATITFSDKTLTRVAQVMGIVFSQPDLKTLVFEYSLQEFDETPYNKRDRSLALLVGIRDRKPPIEAQELLVEIIERISYQCRESTPLVASLGLDGLVFNDDGKLVPTEPLELGPALTSSRLEESLKAMGLTVALIHYQQAVTAFVDGQGESSNGCVRSFLADLIPELCKRRTGVSLGDNVGNALSHLKDKDHSIDDGEYQMFKAFFGRLHTEGSHPGLTAPEEAVFRLKVATLLGQYLIHRLKKP